MRTFEETRHGYRNLWDAAKVLTEKQSQARDWAEKISAAQGQLEPVEKATGVPWFVVGLWLMRESSLNFSTYLGNGQSIHHVTTEVPAGRGPWASFLEGAVDAIQHDGFMHAGPWVLEYVLWGSEKWNGQGYFSRGVNDPYIWAWTTEYHGGKFIEDGKFSAVAWDPQPGIAAVLKMLVATNADVAKALATDQQKQQQEQQKKEPTMPVTPPTTTSDPIPQIEAALQTAEKFLPFVVQFLPPPIGPALTVGLPILEKLLAFIEQTKSGGFDIKAFGTLLHELGTHFQGVGVALQVPTPPPPATPNV